MIDQIYTPKHIADDLARIAKSIKDSPKNIADFACGDGSLLTSAREKFGNNPKYIANDIDEDSIKLVNWCDHTYNDDFNLYTREFNFMFRDIDLILLNPPFSYKSSTGILFTSQQGFTTKCSPAMSFILNAIDFLSHDGIIIGIFPDSVMWSERDDPARKHINFLGYVITKIYSLPASTFTGYTVSTSVLIIKRGAQINTRSEVNSIGGISIDRGKIQMHKLNEYISLDQSGPIFLHTTNLKDNEIQIEKEIRVERKSILQPPYALLPRVGSPRPDKIVKVIEGNYQFSDCLIYIKSDNDQLDTIIDGIQRDIHSIYGGSCAKYTTLKILRKKIETLI